VRLSQRLERLRHVKSKRRTRGSAQFAVCERRTAIGESDQSTGEGGLRYSADNNLYIPIS